MTARSLNYADRARRVREQETYTRAYQITTEYVDRLHEIRLALKDAMSLYVTGSAAIEMAIDALHAVLAYDRVEVKGLRVGDRLRPRIRVRAPSRKVTADPFVNPDNPAETWCGRGRQPNWFKELQRQKTAQLAMRAAA